MSDLMPHTTDVQMPPVGDGKPTKLHPVLEELTKIFEEEKPPPSQGVRVSVSRTVSILAVMYEKARNAVEFRAEHLVRRAAIERILKRRIMLNGGSVTIAENLIVELLWARYIDSSLIDEQKIAQIQQIVQKYYELKQKFFTGSGSYEGITWDTVLGIASSEIDEFIVSPKKREALVNFFYQSIRPKINLQDMDERLVNMQTYIAVERAYAQSDDALIAFHLLNIIMPEWTVVGKQFSMDEQLLFLRNLKLINDGLRNVLGERLARYVRKHTPPFLLIRDFFFSTGTHAREYLTDKFKFEQKLSEIATHKYQEIGAKVRRAVIRSIIYIFLTKMLFALALEAPVDLFITRRIDYIPLFINMLFPPLLLFLIAGLFRVPGAENTRTLVDRIKKIVYQFDELKLERDVFTTSTFNKRPILTAIFSLFYLVAFLISFGLISFVLSKLHFNWASQVIFIFFVTLVSFFAYRIRQSAKEYEMIDRQGILEPVIDFFFLPILRAGHLLSREIARINIFIFLFDFILEAPLKVIFDVVEEWIRFIRTKKDEII